MDKLAEHTNNVKSNEVIGVSVINQDKENLGKVYELVIDKFSGKVIYVVLESGALLGLGGKFFAIPWKAFKYDLLENAFIVQMQKEQLIAAPGFDKENWPNIANADWNRAVATYYEFV